MGKPEIPVGKSHASHHSILEASEKIWAVICGDAIFLLFSACSADFAHSHICTFPVYSNKAKA